jgi:hypothetical protein
VEESTPPDMATAIRPGVVAAAVVAGRGSSWSWVDTPIPF